MQGSVIAWRRIGYLFELTGKVVAVIKTNLKCDLGSRLASQTKQTKRWLYPRLNQPSDRRRSGGLLEDRARRIHLHAGQIPLGDHAALR